MARPCACCHRAIDSTALRGCVGAEARRGNFMPLTTLRLQSPLATAQQVAAARAVAAAAARSAIAGHRMRFSCGVVRHSRAATHPWQRALLDTPTRCARGAFGRRRRPRRRCSRNGSVSALLRRRGDGSRQRRRRSERRSGTYREEVRLREVTRKKKNEKRKREEQAA